MAQRTTREVTRRSGKNKIGILSAINRFFSVDPHVAPFETIAREAGSLRPPDRHYLLAAVDQGLKRVDCRKSESVRVGLVKIMVALLPESSDIIKRWLLRSTGRFVPEVHFSLFCFLHFARDVPNAEEFCEDIPKLVGDYLAMVKHDTAKAPWMAGDFLGEHWNSQDNLEILLRLAKSAPFVAGREGALHGLSHLASNGSSQLQGQIIATTKEISRTDKSRRIRKYSQSIAKGKFY
jgi:hypothetical protein